VTEKKKPRRTKQAFRSKWCLRPQQAAKHEPQQAAKHEPQQAAKHEPQQTEKKTESPGVPGKLPVFL